MWELSTSRPSKKLLDTCLLFMALLNCAAIHDCIKSGWEGKSSKYMCIQMRLQIKEEIKWNKNAFGVQSLMLAFPGFRSFIPQKIITGDKCDECHDNFYWNVHTITPHAGSEFWYRCEVLRAGFKRVCFIDVVKLEGKFANYVIQFYGLSALDCKITVLTQM